MTVQEKPAVIVVSHGTLCEGLVSATSMIYGELDRVEALPLRVGMDPEEYLGELRDLVASYGGNVVLLADIMGGTPFNSIMKLGRELPLYAVAGMSMPLLLAVLEYREAGSDLATICASASADGASAVVDMTPKLKQFLDMANEER